MAQFATLVAANVVHRFEMVLEKRVTLTEEQVSKLYNKQRNEPYYDDLVSHMSSGPCIALLLRRPAAVRRYLHRLHAQLPG